MAKIKARKGQAPGKFSREAFRAHYLRSVSDPRFEAEHDAILRLEEIVWKNYCEGRKAPKTAKADSGYAGPGAGLREPRKK